MATDNISGRTTEEKNSMRMRNGKNANDNDKCDSRLNEQDQWSEMCALLLFFIVITIILVSFNLSQVAQWKSKIRMASCKSLYMSHTIKEKITDAIRIDGIMGNGVCCRARITEEITCIFLNTVELGTSINEFLA